MSVEAIAATERFHPLSGEPVGSPPRIRRDLVEHKHPTPQAKRLAATYDAARTSDEFKNYWANADRFDADSAHSPAVRSTLVSRSRYEIGNNGYSDGIAQTYATDLVGIGPTLRMQTGSEGFNRLVETEWYAWTKAVQFRRKLWTMAHAKHGDGEGLGVARRNENIRHAVKLDFVLHETEQCQTPMLPWGTEGYIDGIKFDKFGNPEWYDILPTHPGSGTFQSYGQKAERVPAKYVMHWFKMRRPGQHRGIPECVSTLNTGAAARRWREAILGAAETAADFTTILKTLFQPDEMDGVSPMSSLEIQKRMMTALPAGWEMQQMKAEHPNATFEAFNKALINEQARAKNMPYNKAACDSSSYNYASGRLDHQTYYGSLDVERADCDDLVLDPLFDVWFDFAVMKFGWLGGNPEAIGYFARSHSWDWPKHPVADIVTEAQAQDIRLKNGMTSPSREHSLEGRDRLDELPQLSSDFNSTPETFGETLRLALFNNQNQLASMAQAESQRITADANAKRAAQPAPQPQGASNG